jgi:hypothetical protein
MAINAAMNGANAYAGITPSSELEALEATSSSLYVGKVVGDVDCIS